ncbi:hypothetical protein [Pseudomonas sp. 25 E 4]|nr:hypothetical protein [Pseudomonas sp. 25 E 4]
MRVGAYKGYVISVFIRDEHCPPHVHVRGKEWDARFRFSFLNADVELWDVDPERRRPPKALLNEIGKAITQRHYLARARRIWWENCKRFAWRTIPGIWTRVNWFQGWSFDAVSMSSQVPGTTLWRNEQF